MPSKKIHKLDMSTIDFDKSKLPAQLIAQVEAMDKASYGQLQKNTNAPKDYVLAIAYYWFEEKFLVSEIAALLQRTPQRIHDQLNHFDWRYSQDYQENQRLQAELLLLRAQVLAEARVEAAKIDPKDPQHNLLAQALESLSTQKIGIGKKYQLDSNEEFVRVLYYLHRVALISREEIARLFGKTIHAIRRQLKTYHFAYSKKEGDQMKANRGHDTTERMRKSAIGRYKKQAKNFEGDSQNEAIFRKFMSILLDQEIDSARYEVVVGLSNKGIIGLEVDIPIMIFDKTSNYVHRYAIEYNGDYWHSSEEDLEKKQRLAQAGWHSIVIVDDNQHNYSNNKSKLYAEAFSTCQRIRQQVEGSTSPAC